MDDPAKLLGSYEPHRCEVGAVVECAVRGPVTVGGFTSAPIPWPYVRAHGRRRLIVFGGLLEALRHESGVAIQGAWGISRDQVFKWRRALGIESRSTEGFKALARTLPARTMGIEGQRRGGLAPKGIARYVDGGTNRRP